MRPDESFKRLQSGRSGKAPSFVLSKAVRRCWIALRDALYPPRCLICGVFYDARSHQGVMEFMRLLRQTACSKASPAPAMTPVLTSCVCPACAAGFIPITSPLCPVCGLMFHGRQGFDHLCPACDGSVRVFGKARAVGAYAEKMIQAVHRLKYDGKIQLARPLGMLMFHAFCRIWDDDPVDWVMPVPLHRRRLKSRGFNQASLLVRDWPRYSRLSHRPPFAYRISKEILIRTRWEKSQTGLSRKARSAGVRNAFTVKSPSRVREKKILLVDDVHTTGATIEACAAILRRAGARQVDVLTLARTL